MSKIDQAIADGIRALQANPSKNRALVYPEGFVANAYRWPAPGLRVVVRRLADGTIHHTTEPYDRKRSHGRGPYISVWNS